MKGCLGCLSIIAIFAVICLVLKSVPETKASLAKIDRASKSTKDLSTLGWDACYMAQDHIKSALKAPSTADFPNCYSSTEAAHTNRAGMPGGYIVTTYVDAQNSFGAKLRGYYMCAVNTKDGDHFTVSCLETDADHKRTLNIF